MGDTWVYESVSGPGKDKREVTIEVREVTADSIHTESVGSGSVFSRDWRLRETRRGGEVTLRADPPRPLLDFPLEVGKKWDGRAVTYHADGFVQRWQGAARVERLEKVTVPAGTFDAFLIRYEAYYPSRNGRSNVRWVESIWYAPEAGRWVKRDYEWDTSLPHGGRFNERTIEQLVSYKRNGGTPAATGQ